jgi:hypothetical protein
MKVRLSTGAVVCSKRTKAITVVSPYGDERIANGACLFFFDASDVRWRGFRRCTACFPSHSTLRPSGRTRSAFHGHH